MPGRDRGDRKSGHRKDGTSIWTHAAISGPGVWATCIKGKERQCAGELIDLFEELAGELYPELPEDGPTSSLKVDSNPLSDAKTSAVDGDSDDADLGLSVEEQVAREVAKLRRPQKQRRFANLQTNTTCVVFISVRTPVDPVKLVLHHIGNVKRTGRSRTRHTHRLVPSAGTCTTVMHDMKALMTRLVRQYFDGLTAGESSRVFRYKIELRIRNHNTFDRPTILKELAECVPPEHKVDLTDPEVFVLVEVLKSTCGISIVQDYYALSKFNVVELAQANASEVVIDADAPEMSNDADAIYARLS